MPESMFTKATKAQAKARIAISGPSGSGKTWLALKLATDLAEGGTIAVIDTERNSASLYADVFEFSAINMTPPFKVERVVELLKAAESEGFAVANIDSLSHFWSGKGGVLDTVDQAQARGANNFTAWAEGTPQQNALVDNMLGFDGHLIATMRSKTEYVIDRKEGGRSEIRKLGSKPIQRDGIEFEFTLVIDMDTKHNATITKTRCAQLADRTFSPSEHDQLSREFINWLKAGDPLITQNEQDTLSQKIGSLSDASKGYLRRLWSEAGLPKINALTTTTAPRVRELIQRVIDESGQPTSVVETPPNNGADEAFASLEEMSQVEA